MCGQWNFSHLYLYSSEHSFLAFDACFVNPSFLKLNVLMNWYRVQHTATLILCIFLSLYLHCHTFQLQKQFSRKSLLKNKRFFSHLDWNCLENYITIATCLLPWAKHSSKQFANIITFHLRSHCYSLLKIRKLRLTGFKRLLQNVSTRRFAQFHIILPFS